MDNFNYRIRTDGRHFICEIQQDGWRRVCLQNGHVLTASNSSRSSGEYFDSEKELLQKIEDVMGTSARRVREWRTV